MNIKQWFEKHIFNRDCPKHECSECDRRFETSRGLKIHNSRSRKNGKHKFVKVYGYYL